MMLIIEKLKEAAALTTGLKAFGYGDAQYADLKGVKAPSLTLYGKDSELYPRLWVYNPKIKGKFNVADHYDEDYICTMVLTKPCSFGNDTQEILNGHRMELLTIWREFIQRFKALDGVLSVTDPYLTAIMPHRSDANVLGYYIEFTVEVFQELPVPCE